MLDPKILFELFNYLSGAERGSWCFVKKNLKHFPPLQSLEGTVVKVEDHVTIEGCALWSYTPLIVNEYGILQYLPDCVLVPIPDFDPEINEDEDEMIKIAGKAPQVETREPEKV